MLRLFILTLSILGAVSFTPSPAQAQLVRITPGNTCLAVIHVVPRCQRGWLPLCTRFVNCTYRGRPSRVCTAYRCIPRHVIPRPRPGQVR